MEGGWGESGAGPHGLVSVACGCLWRQRCSCVHCDFVGGDDAGSRSLHEHHIGGQRQHDDRCQLDETAGIRVVYDCTR